MMIVFFDFFAASFQFFWRRKRRKFSKIHTRRRTEEGERRANTHLSLSLSLSLCVPLLLLLLLLLLLPFERERERENCLLFAAFVAFLFFLLFMTRASYAKRGYTARVFTFNNDGEWPRRTQRRTPFFLFQRRKKDETKKSTNNERLCVCSIAFIHMSGERDTSKKKKSHFLRIFYLFFFFEIEKLRQNVYLSLSLFLEHTTLVKYTEITKCR